MAHRQNIDYFSYLYAVTPYTTSPMDCRSGCGACCVALSISSPLPGMAEGKLAGVRCIHLLDDYRCSIYNDLGKPKVCSDFNAEPEFCGSTQEEAMRILGSLSK